MKRESPTAVSLLITFASLLVLWPGVVTMAPAAEGTSALITVQSDLDYLQSAKLRISIEMKLVTARQAYSEIAEKAGLVVAYDGTITDHLRRDFSFKNMALKEILTKMGAEFDVSYRVEHPNKLTVIGASSK